MRAPIHTHWQFMLQGYIGRQLRLEPGPCTMRVHERQTGLVLELPGLGHGPRLAEQALFDY